MRTVAFPAEQTPSPPPTTTTTCSSLHHMGSKRRPSDRYVRLCHHNDFELRHALQLLHIDYATFGLPAVYDPPPVPADHLASFSVFSPSPAAPTENQHLNNDSFSLSPAVLNSVVSAALATREPYVSHQSNDGQDGGPHHASSGGRGYMAMPAGSSSSSRKVARPSLNSNDGSGSGGVGGDGADVMDLHDYPLRPPRPPPSTISPAVSNTHAPAPLASTPSTSRPQAQQLLRTNSFQTARSRLHRSSSSSLNRSTPDPRSRPSPPQHQQQQQQQHAPLHSSAITRNLLGTKRPRPLSGSTPAGSKPQGGATDPDLDPDLPEVPNVDPKLVQLIMNETLDKSPGVEWDDIAGLTFAKQCVMEAVVWPMLRPDIFSGLRGPPKGLLLFGPPGTGKTMIGRAIASKSGARFFNISASSLVSKWAGEGEKTVRALFGVARIFQPSVVFIDEIDSLLTQRSDGEQEYTRRIKTEFLVQMDGAGTSREDRILVVGATNRPQELDEAARRRLVKRLYIPLPDTEARCSLIRTLMVKQSHALSDADVSAIAELSKGYSGSDMYALCAEAALGPVRDLGDKIRSIEASSVRDVNMSDFRKACRMVRASVSQNDLDGYVEWNESFGSFSMKDHNQQDENGSETRMGKD